MYYEKYYNNHYLIKTVSVIISKKNNPIDCDSDFYSYSIITHLYDEKQYDAAIWCEENCIDEWLVGARTSAFKNEQDAMAFKLRWI